MATTPNAVHLPSTPVPKELLNINGGGTRVVTQSMMEPLNPANIPLPPSVASALQSINEKVRAFDKDLVSLSPTPHRVLERELTRLKN